MMKRIKLRFTGMKGDTIDNNIIFPLKRNKKTKQYGDGGKFHLKRKTVHYAMNEYVKCNQKKKEYPFH